MEKGKILVKPVCFGFWFAHKVNQEGPVFGRYGLTKEQAVVNLEKSFPEFGVTEVVGDNNISKQGLYIGRRK